ncbi:hypothetical protein R2F61_09135 [Mollicutes bacterium LVI A0078]|nr:hypothetical protein RZE84_08910 [Mollicutes bacterium LVI A0075]WOO90863.1 hypothetical protein R2F61_09135 [Mollicutes bacterium LVI A0078]
MIKVDESNIKRTKQFIIENLKRSGFIYGNLSDAASENYIYERDGEILAMTNVIGNQYCTYLFPENTSIEVVEDVIKFMVKVEHQGGTVTGDYYDIISKYYNVPSNARNEVASLQVTEANYKLNNEVNYLSTSDIDNYKQSLDTIKEFAPHDYKSVVEMFERTQVTAIKKDNQIISSACLSAISDRTAVITGVFTIEGHGAKGYASDCVSKLLNDYAPGRIILIFFSNPVAKHVYLNLGFEVDDKLIMFNEIK